MIRYVRSQEIPITKDYGKLVAHHKALRDWLNTNYPDVKVQLFKTRAGNTHKVYLMADFEDMAAWDRWWLTYQSDPRYGQFQAQQAGGMETDGPYFVTGSDSITLLETL